MFLIKVLNQIQASRAARAAIREYVGTMRESIRNKGLQHGPSFDGFTAFVANFIASASSYATDCASVSRPDPENGIFPASQSRIAVIKELEAFGRLLSDPKARVRARPALTHHAEHQLWDSVIASDEAFVQVTDVEHVDGPEVVALVPIAKTFQHARHRVKRAVAARSQQIAAGSKLAKAPAAFLFARHLRPNVNLTLQKILERATRNADGCLEIRSIRNCLGEDESLALAAKYSLGLHLGSATKSKAKILLADVAEVRAVTPTQIEILLKSPNPEMEYVLTDLHFAMVPAGFTDWQHPIGTGPFKLTLFEPAVRARTERNPNYWRRDRGFVDAVETLVINDATARLSALRSGTVHIVNGVDFKVASLLRRSPNISLVVTEGKQHFALPMNANTAPFSNPDVVLALQHSIDRDKLVNVIMSGYAKVGNDQPIAASDPSFNPEIPQRSYDPEKARFYLKKAGQEQLSVDLHVASAAFEQAIDTAAMFAESAKLSGITINIKREPDDGYWSGVWMKRPWVASFWAGRPSANMMFSSVYASTAPWNETGWKNDAFDRKLLESRSLSDPAKRRELYFEMQKIIYDECSTVIPAFASWVDAHRKDVKGFVPNPNFMLSDHRVAERVWLES